jgi:hypothetical protein
MQRNPLVKLGFAVLIAAAAVIGLGSAPARALDCPYQYGTCVFTEVVCNEGECCCYYFNTSNPEAACPNYCY